MLITREFIVQALVMVCALTVLLAVIADFLLFSQRTEIRQGQKSIVRTSTMVGFYVATFLVIRYRIWLVPVSSPIWSAVLDIAGLALLVTGAITNICGRLWLKQNWGDHIRIYTDHTLVTRGPFRIVRHPLYASLVWMFTGGALVYRSPLVLLMNGLIFTPFMVYRARQEERLLVLTFPEYEMYRRRTGLFFPKIGRR